MSVLTSANVKLLASWLEGVAPNRRRKARKVEVFGGSWGGSVNTMPAVAFGLSVIEEVTGGMYYGHYIPLVPTSNGSTLSAFGSVGVDSEATDVALAGDPDGMVFILRGY